MARKSRATGKKDGAAAGSQLKRRASEEGKKKPAVIRNLSAIDPGLTPRPLLRVIKGDKK